VRGPAQAGEAAEAAKVAAAARANNVFLINHTFPRAMSIKRRISFANLPFAFFSRLRQGFAIAAEQARS
jgi:hypothetical protein